MRKNPDLITAKKMLLAVVGPVSGERVPLSECGGRILAEDLAAFENIPAFDYALRDGYAFRAADTAGASPREPVALRILEEIPAGAAPTVSVAAGTAVKILTGAPIPEGADTVIPYEGTAFTKETVSIASPWAAGNHIRRVGEDVRAGDVLAPRGTVIEPAVAGMLASQGIAAPTVYRRPRVGLLSTGSELVELTGAPPPFGKIRNSNRYALEAALKAAGCESVWLGIAGDSVPEISALMAKGLAQCDVVISTGGVSAGDYDLTPEAMARTGAELLFHGVDLKPGKACVYGVCGGKPLCGLSGKPASALANFYAIALPALKKIKGEQPDPCGE